MLEESVVTRGKLVSVVVALVAATLGLPVGPDLQGQALAHLAQAPAVVVLDNAETPWWADAAGAEETSATLAATALGSR